MLHDILGEEQEDPACLWIQQVNTEGGHRNIKVPITKTESLTNFILDVSKFLTDTFVQVTYLKNFSLFVESKVETLGIQEHVSLGKALVSQGVKGILLWRED